MKVPQKNNRVILGLSGGVDSTTAALLLKEKGYQVIGLFLDVLGDNLDGVKEAEKVANEVGIDFIHKDVSKVFDEIVIKNFCDEYLCGRTPNPCVICNPTVKFKTLIDTANEEGAYYIATGHYARLFEDNDGHYFVQQAKSTEKDQSYMLYRLGQDVLSRLLLPLGKVNDKTETRALAKKHKLFNADKADSQEICFIEDGKKAYVDFIEQRFGKSRPGDFVDMNGKVIGQHKGMINYTIGQRKGLGITFGKPVFVTKLDAENNKVTLGKNEDLFSNMVISNDNYFVENSNGELPGHLADTEIFAKVRYAAKPARARLKAMDDGKVLAIFEQPQRAATSGQSIVFYVTDENSGISYVVGGGFIDIENS